MKISTGSCRKSQGTVCTNGRQWPGRFEGEEIKAETEWTARWVFRYDKSRRKSPFPLLFASPFAVSFNVTLKFSRYFQQRGFTKIGRGEEGRALFRAGHLYGIVQPRFFVSLFRSSFVFRETEKERKIERVEASNRMVLWSIAFKYRTAPLTSVATAPAVASSCFGASSRGNDL